MGLLEDCQELFGSSDLYEVLGLERSSSEAEVRRGYYKNSLKVHPDRAPDDQRATTRFQTLGKVYAVLSDAEQRAAYDERGVVDEESDSLTQERDWDEYWRLLFPKIRLQDILDFEKTYKGSEEERLDLLRLYSDCSGDMNRIMDAAMCAGADDEPRIRLILQAAIDGGDLPALRAFTHESRRKKAARKRKADTERAQSEQLKQELGVDEGGSLSAIIKRRASSRESDFSSLIGRMEEKYCNKKPKAAKKKLDH
ncbi:dnaJ homolog subfamily C member 9-like isoform X1 [Siniperca chuatsi]|uniref:dnaJ homolog subfamily C member 9-like isoform X1 n=1 Tax=Siniperca chuatsi TaxID=119488 RepID=UPI001CE20BC3|nr:dnaJ homolog subfamily C member 9-like isoform X1 [Siniperca chuatsi]XP_044035857.1 dnaJ homolog subfamily C member 9-like isoform X1 [Siniperca chuatsi]XP_044035858.1 dnaJ homolog subfamily C member 9-like isoform X1 [Siniperca chuatsi]